VVVFTARTGSVSTVAGLVPPVLTEVTSRAAPGPVGTAHTRAVAVSTAWSVPIALPPIASTRSIARCRTLIDPHFQFEFKTSRLN
jgi:hypothetical protein